MCFFLWYIYICVSPLHQHTHALSINCNTLRHIATTCNNLQHTAITPTLTRLEIPDITRDISGSKLQCFAVFCSMLQCAAMCCSVSHSHRHCNILPFAWCSVLQCVCECETLHHIAAHCNILQRTATQHLHDVPCELVNRSIDKAPDQKYSGNTRESAKKLFVCMNMLFVCMNVYTYIWARAEEWKRHTKIHTYHSNTHAHTQTPKTHTHTHVLVHTHTHTHSLTSHYSNLSKETGLPLDTYIYIYVHVVYIFMYICMYM